MWTGRETSHGGNSLNGYILQAENCLKIISKKVISNCYQTAKGKFEELNNKLERI